MGNICHNWHGAYQRTHQQQLLLLLLRLLLLLQVARGINANYVQLACMCVFVVVWITGDQRPERGMFLAIFHFLAIGEKLTEKLPASYGLALRLLKLLRLRLDCQQHLEWVSLDVDLDLDTRLGRCLCGDKAPNVQQACAGSNRHCHQRGKWREGR